VDSAQGGCGLRSPRTSAKKRVIAPGVPLVFFSVAQPTVAYRLLHSSHSIRLTYGPGLDQMDNQTMDTLRTKGSLVTFGTSQGVEVRASILSLTRHAAVFEVYSPETVIKVSESLEDFRIYVNDQPAYTGRAVVRNIVNTGTVSVCSVALEDHCFEVEFFQAISQAGQIRAGFEDVVAQWERVCKVLPEFKVAVADIQTFLIDLRRWLEQIELGIRSSPRSDSAQQERATLEELKPQVLPVIDTLFEKFEIIAASLPEELRPVHRSYVQRHLHPIVLCAPFAYRCYRKPLGYAGDYEMVNMMMRDASEGSSLFAKMFNIWLLQQGSAVAHRNRIKFLKARLVREAARAARLGRKARILNLGCGPAQEIQEFLADSELSNSTQFTLLDFNDETLRFATQALRQKQTTHGRSTAIELVKKSVQQVLKEMTRSGVLGQGAQFDLIYCAGLFDYLPDRICKRLMTLFHNSLAPGGLVLATNVAPFSPNRGSLELILDWHLIYRDASHAIALRPEGIPPEELLVEGDETSVNVFFEARKANGV
jgi:extracellular factor (EF) 3-hydroxypalmitic acid methyl ester biosynthesis protein